jgi:hypothetical protein
MKRFQDDAMEIFLAAPPGWESSAPPSGFEIAHLDYKLEDSRLWRAAGGGARGGLMVCEIAGPAAVRDPLTTVRTILAECTARDYSGVVLDIEGAPDRTSAELARLISAAARDRGLRFFAAERLALAAGAPYGGVLIHTALSGGSLEARLRDATDLFGAGHAALEIDVIAEDFTLPAPRGEGRELSRSELSALAARHCQKPHFSEALCCNYFTYRDGTARHFILYDDLGSVRAKLSLGARLGIDAAFLFLPHAADFAFMLRDAPPSRSAQSQTADALSRGRSAGTSS